VSVPGIGESAFCPEQPKFIWGAPRPPNVKLYSRGGPNPRKDSTPSSQPPKTRPRAPKKNVRSEGYAAHGGRHAGATTLTKCRSSLLNKEKRHTWILNKKSGGGVGGATWARFRGRIPSRGEKRTRVEGDSRWGFWSYLPRSEGK